MSANLKRSAVFVFVNPVLANKYVPWLLESSCLGRFTIAIWKGLVLFPSLNHLYGMNWGNRKGQLGSRSLLSFLGQMPLISLVSMSARVCVTSGFSHQSNSIFFHLSELCVTNLYVCVGTGKLNPGSTHILNKCSYHWGISLALKFLSFYQNIRNRLFGFLKKDFGLFWVTFFKLRSRLPARFWPVRCGWQAELHSLSLPFPLCAQRGWLCQDEDHHSAQTAARVLGLPLPCAYPRRGTVWVAEPLDCHMRGRHEVCIHSLSPSLALWLRYGHWRSNSEVTLWDSALELK